MSRHISSSCFYDLPSGARVHPCRLIHKDGTLMWKHALLHNNEFVCLPEEQAHEAHIIKTAQRVEELNSWVSQNLDPWEFLKPIFWYAPGVPDLSEGISVYLRHTSLPTNLVVSSLENHIQDHETLKKVDDFIFFQRC